MVRTVRELYFVLNWHIMRCQLRRELAAEAQQTARSKMQAKVKSSSQYTLIIPHRVIQLTTISFWVPETGLRLPQVNKFPPKRVKYLAITSSIVLSFFLIYRTALRSQPIRGKFRRIGRIFPEHEERSLLDPDYSFVAVRRKTQTIFAKQSSTS